MNNQHVRFGSVCSGIEAASVAWHPLGWKAAWLSEIEPFPCAVLAHHYPDVPNLGDMTTITGRILAGEVEAPDVFTGGTPCQAFSVAGLRRSLDDARGNLSLTFCEIANAIDTARSVRGEQPCIIMWENVPGVLSTKDNAFGCFLAELVGGDEPLTAPAGKWTDAGCVSGPRRTAAWRVLDAQYFGLAQRRRRVFVVASARDGFDPAAVLFEFDGVRRDSAPRREAGKDTAGSTGAGAEVRRWPADIASTLNAAFGDKQGLEDQHALSGAPLFVPAVMGTLTARMLNTTQVSSPANYSNPKPGDPCHPLAAGAGEMKRQDWETCTMVAQPVQQCIGTLISAGGAAVAVAMRESGQGYWMQDDIAGTLRAEGENRPSRPSHVIRVHAPAAALYASDLPINFGAQMSVPQVDIDLCQTLQAKNPMAVAPVCPTLRAGGNSTGGDRPPGTDVDTADSLLTAASGMAVRRLTPRECERLQGFPDDYTAIPWRNKPADQCPDGPRYKALGNSWAVPCAAWIGARIDRAMSCGGSVEVAA